MNARGLWVRLSERALLLPAARSVNLQVARADDRRVSRAISDLQHNGAGVKTFNDSQVQQVAAAAWFQVVHGTPDERNRDRLSRIATDATQDASAMEINDVYVDLR